VIVHQYADHGAKLDSLARLSRLVPVVFGLSFVCAVFVRYFSLFPSVIDSDESLYLVMAQHWLDGELPYRSVWDQHSVGLPALLAGVQYLFPSSIVAVRLSSCAAVAVTATTIYFALRAIDGKHAPSVVASLLYIAWTSRFWGLPANCELYLNALVSPAMYVLLVQPKVGRTGLVVRLLLSALLLGVAWQVKHVIVFQTVLWCVGTSLLLFKARCGWPIVLAVAACLALPTAVVVYYFYEHGLWGEYFHAMVISNLSYAGQRPGIGQILARIPLGYSCLQLLITVLAGSVILGRRDRRSIFLLLWAVSACLDVGLPGQFWAHYVILILPATSMLAGHLVAALSRTLARWFDRPRLAALLLCLTVALACQPVAIYRDAIAVRTLAQHDVPRIVSQRITEHASPNDHVFVFNYQPIVYWLTKARLATRYVLPVEWSRQFKSVSEIDPMGELAAVVSRRPTFVVVTDKDLVGMDDMAVREIDRLLSSYELWFQVRDEVSMTAPVLVSIYRKNHCDKAR
jgi:hypothetical protein